MKIKLIFSLVLIGTLSITLCNSRTGLFSKDEKRLVTDRNSGNIDSSLKLKVMLELPTGSPMGQL